MAIKNKESKNLSDKLAVASAISINDDSDKSILQLNLETAQNKSKDLLNESEEIPSFSKSSFAEKEGGGVTASGREPEKQPKKRSPLKPEKSLLEAVIKKQVKKTRNSLSNKSFTANPAAKANSNVRAGESKRSTAGAPELNKIPSFKELNAKSNMAIAKGSYTPGARAALGGKMSRSRVTSFSSEIEALYGSPGKKILSGFKMQQANVKVAARIRPLNPMEKELLDNNVGAICFEILNETTIKFKEGQTYALDHMFGPDTKQTEVYDIIGKPVLEDVVNGYNATIFAYGQTGSGKTFTMFGNDILDAEFQGIIPRAANALFEAVGKKTGREVSSVEIHCSMIEIYKEDLRDLLLESEEDALELRIKESPVKGVYVDGLSEVPIASVEDLLGAIQSGESKRVWAETRYNHVSSRSHTIFMICLKQTLINDTEKKGTLNLVDLAGSEKVGKSGAQGTLFEEGTKINLSLSALGNVIHSLTTHMDHIPYRDSKLTRLLQESLGGNYKTALIVTASPHSSQLAETISTFQFASRAKKLKNNVKINIKRSADQLMKIIEQLQDELSAKSNEIEKLTSILKSIPLFYLPSRIGNPPALPPTSDNKGQFKSKLSTFAEVNNSALYVPEARVSDLEVEAGGQSLNATTEEIKKPDSRTIFPLAEDIFLGPSANVDASAIDKESIELLQKKTSLLELENASLKQKLKAADLELTAYKSKLMAGDKKIKELEQQIAAGEYYKMNAKEAHKSESMQLAIVQSQLKATAAALEDCEAEVLKLLKEKKAKQEKEIVELVPLKLSSCCQSISAVEEKHEKMFITPNEVFSSSHPATFQLSDKELLSMSDYSSILKTDLVENSVPAETFICLLRSQLIESEIINHNLRSIISILISRSQLEKGVYFMQTQINQMDQKKIDAMEKLIASHISQDNKLSERLQKLDYELDLLKHARGHGIALPRIQVSGIHRRIEIPLNGSLFKRSFCEGLHKVPKLGTIPIKQCLLPSSPSLTEDDGVPKQEIVDDEKDNIDVKAIAGMREVSSPQFRGLVSAKASAIKTQELQTLQLTLHQVQTQLLWQKTYSDTLNEELKKIREQKELVEDQFRKGRAALEKINEEENQNWLKQMKSIKTTYDNELTRKQQEISKMHRLLGQWMEKYMDLESAKGLSENKDSLSSLIKETAKSANMAALAGKKT